MQRGQKVYKPEQIAYCHPTTHLRFALFCPSVLCLSMRFSVAFFVAAVCLSMVANSVLAKDEDFPFPTANCDENGCRQLCASRGYAYKGCNSKTDCSCSENNGGNNNNGGGYGNNRH